MRITHFLLLSGLLLFPLLGCSKKTELQPYYIGHVAPLTGPERHIGEHQKHAILLAVEDINTDENRIGNRQMSVLHVDSAGVAERARSEVVRLITVNKVAAILGGSHYADAERIGATTHLYSVPLLTPSAMPDLTSRSTLFSLGGSPDFHGQTLAKFVDEHLKKKRVVVLIEDQDPGVKSPTPLHDAIAAAFIQQWRTAPERWVLDLHYSGDPKWSEMVDRLRKEKAEAVVLAGRAKSLEKFRQQLESEKLTLPVIFAGEAADLAELQRSPERNKGIYGATLYVPKAMTEEGKKFTERYKERFHAEPDLHAFQGYEMAQVLFEALRETEAATGAKLVEELSKEREFTTLTGTYTFTKGRTRRPLWVIQIGEKMEPKQYKP